MSGIKVLLAEDHVITRQGMCRLLEEESDLAVVGEAGDGEEAVQMVTERQPDVIIMDIAMPKLNGIEATRQTKLLCPSTAVLALSAYDDDEYVFGLLEAGAAGYLLKTANGDQLIHAIRAVYKGEPVLDPIVARKVINRFRSPGQVMGSERRPEHLSDREMDVMKLAAKGMSNKEIADELVLSKRTVEGHLRSIFNKLGVASRTEAVLYGLRKGWFALEDLY
jgi:NarL family two-component system response regulator LiaR